MKLIEKIEATKTWTCPKTGWWKVICIGGGGSPTYKLSSDDSTYQGQAGGTTSFGTYLSALGGELLSISTSTNERYIGFSLERPELYGERDTTQKGAIPVSRKGYGASGVSPTTSGGASASCGHVEATVIDLTANAVINCTVGKAGTTALASDNYAYVNSGTDGAIILQYLGSEV